MKFTRKDKKPILLHDVANYNKQIYENKKMNFHYILNLI